MRRWFRFMAIILIIDGSNDISVGVRFFLLLIAFE